MRRLRGAGLLCLLGIGLSLFYHGGVETASAAWTSCGDCMDRGPHIVNKHLLSLVAQAKTQGRLIFVLYTGKNTAPGGERVRNTLMEVHEEWLNEHFLVGNYLANKCDLTFAQMIGEMAHQDGPYWFVLDPNGQGIDWGAFDTIGKNLKGSWKASVEALAESHPPIPARDHRGIAKLYKAARKDFEAGNCQEVDKAMLKLALVWFPAELAGPCKQLWAEFEAEMNKRIGPADWMVVDEDFEGAVAAYEAILKDIGDEGKLGKEVRRKLDELQATLAEQAEHAAEDAPPIEAQHGDPVATDAPDTPDVEEPAAVESDDPPPPPPQPDPQALQRKAAALVQLARGYHERGMKDKAIAKLKQCIETYPDTDAAKDARKLLARW